MICSDKDVRNLIESAGLGDIYIKSCQIPLFDVFGFARNIGINISCKNIQRIDLAVKIYNFLSGDLNREFSPINERGFNPMLNSDSFAGILLTPEILVRKYIKGIIDDFPIDIQICFLSDIFCVPENVIRWRLYKLNIL